MSGYASYLAGWREREERQRGIDDAASRRARELATELARILVTRYRASRVILTGSLARGDFRQGSDIDLAAEGIPPELFFQAGAELERHAAGVFVDLVPLETATAAFRERLAEEGVVLA